MFVSRVFPPLLSLLHLPFFPLSAKPRLISRSLFRAQVYIKKVTASRRARDMLKKWPSVRVRSRGNSVSSFVRARDAVYCIRRRPCHNYLNSVRAERVSRSNPALLACTSFNQCERPSRNRLREYSDARDEKIPASNFRLRGFVPVADTRGI